MRGLLDEPRLRRGQLTWSVWSSTALTPTASASVSQFFVAAVVLGRALDAVQLVGVVRRELRQRVRFHEYTKSWRSPGRRSSTSRPGRGGTYDGAVLVDVPALRERRLGLERLGFSRTSGSMMARSTFDDVVSVALPGSSDGGSAPQRDRSTCSAAGPPPVSVAPVSPAACRLVVVAAAAPGGRESKTATSAATSMSHFFCALSALLYWYKPRPHADLAGRPPRCLDAHRRREVSASGRTRRARRPGCRAARSCSRRPCMTSPSTRRPCRPWRVDERAGPSRQVPCAAS